MDEDGSTEGVVYHAGFPNAAESAERLGLDVQRLLVRHPASTYFWKFSQAVPELGWQPGDIAVVDRALPPRHRDLVVAVVDEAFVARRFIARDGAKALQRPDGTPEAGPAVVWGVVTFVVHQARGR